MEPKQKLVGEWWQSREGGRAETVVGVEGGQGRGSRGEARRAEAAAGGKRRWQSAATAATLTLGQDQRQSYRSHLCPHHLVLKSTRGFSPLHFQWGKKQISNKYSILPVSSYKKRETT